MTTGHDDRPLFHAALPIDWERAQADGVYAMSTRGLPLDDVGFIHCSYDDQVVATANRFYADVAELVLLQIERGGLNVPVVDEAAGGSADEAGERFPHVYGPLPLHAIIAATPWPRGGDGRYRWSDVDAPT